MKIIKGNLIKMSKLGYFDVIAHGANCHCVMGGGIALQIKNHFPQVYAADLKTKRGDRSKLGTYSKAEIFYENTEIFFTFLNFYTQFNFGTHEKQLEEWALKSCLQKAKAEFSGQKFGFPLIGCGLAGGDEKTVLSIFEEEMDGEDVTIVKYAGKN